MKKIQNIKKSLKLAFFFFLICCFRLEAAEEPCFIIGDIQYQLGNQMFQVAAVYSLALDHHCQAYFPDLATEFWWNFSTNREQIFWRLDTSKPVKPFELHFFEPHYNYTPIPFTPYMRIRGLFQSEKYFVHHKQEILDLFAPSKEIQKYLKSKYKDLLRLPVTVGLHVRTYLDDYGHLPNNRDLHHFVGIGYYERAIEKFPEDTVFVVFSDRIEWCKENFAHIPRRFIYIENEAYYHDLYLMSMCTHQIIANSSFSWWGAYLNLNPNKIVIAPTRWVNPDWGYRTQDVIPESWIKVEVDP